MGRVKKALIAIFLVVVLICSGCFQFSVFTVSDPYGRSVIMTTPIDFELAMDSEEIRHIDLSSEGILCSTLSVNNTNATIRIKRGETKVLKYSVLAVLCKTVIISGSNLILTLTGEGLHDSLQWRILSFIHNTDGKK